MPELNIPLARKIVDHITHHPDEFDMANWGRRTACGTTLCIAGHAVVMSGHRIVWDATAGSDSETSYAMYLTDGRQIEDVAMVELGLEPEERHLFFMSDDGAHYYLAELIEAAEERERLAVSNA